jgi:hypothetical protein
VTEYDDQQRPVGEQLTTPRKVFRTRLDGLARDIEALERQANDTDVDQGSAQALTRS